MTPQEKMKQKLESLDIPYKAIKCYGSQITVDCIGKQTADKWAMTLSKFVTVQDVIKTTFENKVNTGTCLNPSWHKGYRMYAKVGGSD